MNEELKVRLPVQPPADVIEMMISLLRDIVRRHPLVLFDVDVEAFIETQLDPTLVAMKAIRKVSTHPTHFVIERQGTYFSCLDLGLGPTACLWGPLDAVHAFSTEREAREVMKICPPDSRVVTAVVELVEPSRVPAAANDAEGRVP